ncbi:BglG family transcription antiterminator [Streptococcus sp. S784/96/1]|uniref:BglG family transcription antiterminator n=1 Tax=Streptococcus sp. S784/96/1 TaxID=2653499 RepID=UPI00138720E7|nr:PRD domain-containing protein [Streptococcus sp. S784/96/1]
MPKIESKLLDIFLENQGVFLTSRVLANAISSSDKTTRKYIGLLNDELQRNGAIIHSKQGNGYKFELTDQILFERYLANQKSKRYQMNDIQHLVSPEDREKYILNQLLLNNAQLTSSTLSQELFLSRTSVSTLLNDIKTKLATYHLSLEISRKKIGISGTETDIRHFIKEYFFSETFTKPVFSLFEQEILNKSDLTEIISIVIDECRNAKLAVSDFIVHNLVIHISLMIKRLRLGNEITYSGKLGSRSQLKEYSVAHQIAEQLQNYFCLELPTYEIDFIYLHLIGTRGAEESSETNLRDSIVGTLENLGRGLDVDLSTDEHLITNIQSHIRGLLVRLKNNVQLENPIKESILAKYRLVVLSIAESFRKIEELSQYDISIDEWVYLSLHILATLEKQQSSQKINALLVCATGVGSARFLKNRIENLFKDRIVVEDVKSYFDLAELDLSSVDVIISSVDLSNLILLKPVIQVNILLETVDIKRIETFLNQSAHFEDIVTRATEPSKPSCLFKEEQFIYFDQIISKEAILEKLLDCLSPRLTYAALTEFKQQLVLRENLGAIVFNDKIAVPHPAKAITDEEQVVIGISKYPILWDDEHKTVQIVFLISPSTFRNEQLKQLSPIIATFANNVEAQQQLLQTPTFENFLNLI